MLKGWSLTDDFPKSREEVWPKQDTLLGMDGAPSHRESDSCFVGSLGEAEIESRHESQNKANICKHWGSRYCPHCLHRYPSKPAFTQSHLRPFLKLVSSWEEVAPLPDGWSIFFSTCWKALNVDNGLCYKLQILSISLVWFAFALLYQDLFMKYEVRSCLA